MSPVPDSDRAILVVEDDEATREAECLLLRGQGYSVTAAADGREALDQLRGGLRPRLILLDLAMPGLDGFAFRDEQLSDPELEDIPVVVCSAVADLEQRAGRLRPAALLPKPVEFEHLAAAVRAVAGDARPGVLVVHDEPHLRELLGLILERDGFAVWSAVSGRAAVEFYRSNRDRIGVVLLDVCPDGPDGPRTLAALRQIDPHVRAIFVSADGGDHGPDALLGLGASAVLQKPFDLEELGRAVRRTLACARPEREAVVCLSIRRAADLPMILEPVAAAMTRLGYSGKAVFGVRLGLEEALVNALKHGNGGDPRKRVRVRYRVTPEEVWAEVEDEGPGFDPADVADPLSDEGVGQPGGRGLLLMRHYFDSVRHNARGNAVILRKGRDEPAAGG